ncbi:MAG TPA: PD-(D/E)XK nuclease family protein, partial [Candidatus Omnitrophota bacterium]|nr:PD-(D/E)XK nuclease family protein [Candidatus Omnitrophota bacterium]
MDRVISYSLAQDFIKELADWLFRRYGKEGVGDMGSIAIVFGGKRPSLFLNKELSKRFKKSFIPPVYFTIDEFVDRIIAAGGAYRDASDLEACFEIYKIARECAWDILKGREDFSAFLPWAREILSFIEQLDLEDVGSSALKNIEALASVGYDVPENINFLLSRIIAIRESFHAVLKEKKTYVRGLKYLLASKNVNQAGNIPFENILFCNFFYLHKTEEAMIRYLYENNKAMLFFQGSEDNWPVLKKTAACLGISVKPDVEIKPEFSLDIKPAFDLHSEVSLVRESLSGDIEPEETVVVLPDPGGVVALLSEISSMKFDLNISMGYPLTRSSVFSLFNNIQKVQESKKDALYYSRDYLRLLNNPLVKNLEFEHGPGATRILVHKIEEALTGMKESDIGGSLFVGLKDIEDCEAIFTDAAETAKNTVADVSAKDLKIMLKELHRLLFVIWQDVNSFKTISVSIKEFFTFLAQNSSVEKYPLNISVIERLLEMSDEYSCAAFSDEIFSKEDLFKITSDHLKHELIRFKGSPLKGLQVLGMLETRALSFKNVFIMDMNESILPRLKIYEPLIPRDVMIALGINRLEKEEEIQRYQFFRLISGAKKVCLFYRESKDLEKSRFIEELIWEDQKKNGVLSALEASKCGFSVEVMPGRIMADKENKHIDFLKDFRFSATSINAYLSCPLRFYYQYVLGLQEKEVLSDEPEAREVGTFIHAFLEDMFSVFVGKPYRLDEAFGRRFFNELERRFEAEFKKKMKSDAFLVKEVLFFRLRNFLENEKKRPVKEVICVEKIFEGMIPTGSCQVRFKSKIDRIDLLEDNSLLVLDYKTGAGELPSSLDRIQSKPWSRKYLKKTIRSFQLPLYLHFAGNAYPGKDIDAGLYQLKDNGKNFGIKTLFEKEITP